MLPNRFPVIGVFVFGFMLVRLYISWTDSHTQFITVPLKTTSNFDDASVEQRENIFDPAIAINNKITIVIVVCPPPNNKGPRDEAVVLLKSIVISAKLNNIKSIEIFFFFENVKRETDFIIGKLQEFGYPFNEIVFNLHFLSANEAVPEKYRKQFIDGTDNKKLLRCTNVRIFFPSALPQLDSILYLDTDVVVHGNLSELWNMWNHMDDEQLIGISTDYEQGSDRADWFKTAPFPPPRGLNAGILLMNLTKMRDFGWEEKLLRIWKDYFTIVPRLNDQHLVNIILYFNTDLLFRLPCHFNYMEQHCSLKSPCKSVENFGVQLIHGAAERFDFLGSFRDYYLAYSQLDFTQLNFSSHEAFRRELQNSYDHYHDIAKQHKDKKRQKLNSECHSILSQLI